jgi:hypothetical protein
MKKTIALVLEGSILVVGVSVATSQPAHAYLDPGTGSYAVQVGLASLVGALFSVKMFWGSVKEAAAQRLSGRKREDIGR